MYIGYSEEHEQLRRELREYYERLLTPEVEEGLAQGRGVGPVNRQVVRRMGEDGWLGIGWPEEYGGQGRSAIEQFIFFDESMRAGAPVPMLTINTVGPTIMDFGTEEQKAEFLPKILKGEIHFCIGYTEPGAGTDLAALTTKAERDGDEYVINGQKMFTSLAGGADYCWLAVRTDDGGRRRPSSPTAGASSTRSGCRCTSPAFTPGSSSCASPTGRWRGTRPRTASTSPMRRRSKCSGPSSTSRRSGCCSR